ncbi:MAG: phenylalanine 4-monooxygenase [Rhodothermaceae bacterium]|nr:phenylalanine 4-monooxygenase [Rhodothermaceae bacterium]
MDPNASAPATEDAPLSAYEKAGAEDIDPRCIPQNLDGPPPVGDEIVTPEYPEEDHANWRFLFERQMGLLQGKASEAFREGVATLGMTPDRIPALRDLSRNMEAATGWKIARIPGLLHERDFFGLLSRRLFPSTDYIRGTAELDYTPAPDCFHDMFGHMPMLTEPAFADFYNLFGQAALNAEGQDRQSLERLHWFTVEFGLIQQPQGMRIFGAGILSSKNEVGHALSDAVDQRPFDVQAVINQDYDVWHLQPILYVLDSFEQLVDGFRGWAVERGLLAN